MSEAFDVFGGHTTEPVEGTTSLHTELLKSAVDDYYVQLGQEPTTGRNYANFELDKAGVLRLKNNPDFNIVNARTKHTTGIFNYG